MPLVINTRQTMCSQPRSSLVRSHALTQSIKQSINQSDFNATRQLSHIEAAPHALTQSLDQSIRFLTKRGHSHIGSTPRAYPFTCLIYIPTDDIFSTPDKISRCVFLLTEAETWFEVMIMFYDILKRYHFPGKFSRRQNEYIFFSHSSRETGKICRGYPLLSDAVFFALWPNAFLSP